MTGVEYSQFKSSHTRKLKLYLQGKKRVNQILEEQKPAPTHKIPIQYPREQQNKENEFFSPNTHKIYEIKISNGEYYRFLIQQKATKNGGKKKKKSLLGNNQSQINFKPNQPNFYRNQKLSKIFKSVSQKRRNSATNLKIQYKNMFPQYGKISNVGLKMFKMPQINQNQRASYLKNKNSPTHQNPLRLNIPSRKNFIYRHNNEIKITNIQIIQQFPTKFDHTKTNTNSVYCKEYHSE